MPGDGGAGTPPAPEPALRDRIMAFAGTALVAVYVLGDEDGDLWRAETGGSGGYPLPERYTLAGRSPAAYALSTGRPLWMDVDEFTAWQETSARGKGTLPVGVSLGVLPLRAGAGGRPRGCLLAVGEAVDGFGPEQRGFLERYADEIAGGLPAGGAPGGTWSVLGPALERLRAGGFALSPSTGRIAADATLLDLVGIRPADFDGTVKGLLAHVVPEDLPALTAVVDASETVAGSRELEFRVRPTTGEPRRLWLSCRVSRDAGGRPERLLGVVVDVSGPRPAADEVLPVRRLSAELADAQTVRDVGRLVVRALRGRLGADRVVLGELEAERLVVTVLDPPQAAAWPYPWRAEWRSEWPDLPVRHLPTLQAALRDGTTRLYPAGAVLEPGLAGVGPGGLAVLPLPAQNRIAGACLVGWDRPHAFGPEERSLLTAIAGLVGQALTRAVAYDAEQGLATMLQRTLLPRRLPALPGGVAVARYLPAMQGLEVGGDWYDVISLSDNHVVLVIGDVQGHSAAAASIMGQMRTAVRAYAVEGHPPDVAVSHANRLLVGMETDLFATCCYADLDMEEGEALFVRAGHPPPLLRLPDGGTEELVVDGGPPLGVLADTEFPMTAVTLTPGTVLALLTDGLVESARLRLEDGLRRVRDALSAADPSDIGRMADDLIGERGPPVDDVALLLLRYDGMKVRPVRASSVVWRLPDAVMHARRFTTRTLRAWDLTDLTDVAQLVISELVTNALVHTHGAVRLDLTLTGDRLRMAVSDSSPRAPARPVVVDWEATGGRGLLLIEAMSGAWGSVPVSGGKQVWSEIVLPPREPAPEDREREAST
jgi:anti-sigma regulatory factor (Ser/Thr protein kinase)